MVEREVDVLAVAARLRVDDLECPPEGILDDGLLALGSRERLVELELEACETLVVDAGIAEHRGPDPLLRVVATLLVVEAEPLDVLVLERLREPRIRLPLDIDEAARAVGEDRVHLVRAQAEGLLDGHGRRPRILDLPRIRVDRRRARANRELHAEPVVDRPAVRRHVDGLAMLVRRQVAECLRAHCLQPPGPQERDGEDGREEGDQEANAPVRNPRGHD